METDENNVPTVVYTHRPERFGELISQERSGVTSYYFYDGEHSTRLLTDDNENITDTYIFSAFGELVARTGTTTNPFGYKGAVGYYTNSATDDIYVRARSYQPVTGRWLSMDPLGFVDGPNLYRAYFVRRGVDPAGLYFGIDNWCEICKCVGTLGLFKCGEGSSCSTDAFTAADEVSSEPNRGGFGVGWNDAKDAFRHCYWACCMSRRLSQSEAILITDIHEVCNPNLPIEHCMDLHNNRIGAQFGQWQPADCKGYCKEAIDNPCGLNGLKLQTKPGCTGTSILIGGVFGSFPIRYEWDPAYEVRCPPKPSVGTRSGGWPSVSGGRRLFDELINPKTTYTVIK